MENSKDSAITIRREEKSGPSPDSIEGLVARVTAYEKEKAILLALSNDLTTVREKTDLIRVFSSRLKSLFYFTHAVISLIDKENGTYVPFLLDRESLHIRHRKELPGLLEKQFLITDPFIAKVLHSDVPVSFLLSEIINQPGIPAFLTVNYECGIKKVMMANLKSHNETIGYVFIYSDQANSFPDSFMGVIEGITPLLSNAVANIIVNEEIRSKELVNEVLLSLSNDMVTVRQRTDLLNVINFGLKKLLYFTHSVMTVADDATNTYRAFLIDPHSNTKLFPEYAAAVAAANPVRDGIYNVAVDSRKPVVVEMSSIDLKSAPLWFRLNFEAGGKELLIKVLPAVGTLTHSIILFSDRQDTFDEKAINLVERISSQLATAASNIAANEEVLNKEKDKAFLLAFSHAIAATRTKSELSDAIHGYLKQLTEIRGYFIRVINEDGATMSPFMYDNEVFYHDKPEFRELLATKISLHTGITKRVMDAKASVMIDFVEEIKAGHSDPYIEFWKKLGPQRKAFQTIIGTRLCSGDRDLGVLWVMAASINMTILEGICAQISIAISNIMANDEIANREQEKTLLLSLSDEIAALRNRDDLLHVVNTRLKKVFAVKEFGIAQVNEDGTTYSAFVLEVGNYIQQEQDFDKIASGAYLVSDPVFTAIQNSEDPVVFDIDEMIGLPHMPAYVQFWKVVGLRRVLGLALRVGGNTIGCVFLHIDGRQPYTIKTTLLKGVCAQLAVAVSNILANEEITNREQEKSILLSLSEQIAALRNMDELLNVVNVTFKTLFKITDFGLLQTNDDGTYSSFVLDLGVKIKKHPRYKEITTARYDVRDKIFSAMMTAEDPVVFDVNAISEEPDMPAYVLFWKQLGIRHVLGTALRVGRRNIGCAFVHIDANARLQTKSHLLKAVFAHLSVAVSNIISSEKVLAYKQLLEVENDHLKEQIKTIYNFSDIIGSGAGMQKVYHMMSLVSGANSTVLVLGETGTGKELIARAIHNASPRSKKLMIKVNCAALPANLIESELFGHEKGSFTGAIERRIGKFELANHSTLFLDEIGEMPLETQVKLLRVIQERELERVGGSVTIKVDVRIIAATNRNLEDEVKAGRFRADLYYRLNVFPITLPPLRERLEDIEPLSNFFLARYTKNTGKRITGIAPAVYKALKSYFWPGNVRELEHLIERSILLTEGLLLKEVQLPLLQTSNTDSQHEPGHRTLEQKERSYIIEVLKRCSGKISGSGGASEILQIPSTTLHSKLKKLRISKSDYF